MDDPAHVNTGVLWRWHVKEEKNTWSQRRGKTPRNVENGHEAIWEEFLTSVTHAVDSVRQKPELPFLGEYHEIHLTREFSEKVNQLLSMPFIHSFMSAACTGCPRSNLTPLIVLIHERFQEFNWNFHNTNYQNRYFLSCMKH